MIVTVLSAAACSAQPGHTGGPPASAEPLDWKTLETPVLTHHVQLTSRDQFLKAGEAYFSPEGKWIVFQAVPTPAEGKTPDPHYSMYVAKLTRDSGGHITGMETPIMISTPGSWNSCGWFHPQQPYKVLFGSTMEPPSTEQHGEFRVGQRTYTWLFPKETDIVIRSVPAIFMDLNPDAAPVLWGDDAKAPVRVIDRPDYDAESSYTKDGRFILYAHVREDRQVGQKADADIWVRDTQTGKDYPLVTADGYDGGPFFSPDEKWICYRSDRKGDDLLQLFVAELRYENGIPVGIAKEYQVTDNGAVNWAPYWDPTGTYLVYGTSEVGHMNYEVFAVEASPAKLRAGATPADLKRVRITHANGADVLPVFSPDGRHMMWTAQRGPLGRGDQRPTSQLWIAEFNAAGVNLGH
ncbi:MAG: PD40 domain-containing protein [Phycisphaeraceae bacterium]|nr:PD40 domain-containing protein [Phycisphaeraceae bacterium]